MTDELKPVPCGCGGEARTELSGEPFAPWIVKCPVCGTRTELQDTEAEAITAWNRAMGTNTRRLLEVLVHDATDTNVGSKERTAKVDRDAIFPVTVCGNCHSVVEYPDKYCSDCGARLEWK